jgi:hypothetical protein
MSDDKKGGTKTPVEPGKNMMPTTAVKNVSGSAELGKTPTQNKKL